ncbi:MAG: tRNA1(Val) (adenine(37)-N6)-methyltransferase [Candidatus Promineifilaceae bacterium]
MSSEQFDFQQFSIQQDRCAMKVGIDAVILGASAEIPSFCYQALDIGSGTGVLALMLAQRSPSTAIDAIELDEDSAAQSAENVANSPFAEQITVYQGTVQGFRSKQSYDLIVCNPPYFNSGAPSPDPARAQARHTESLPHSELLTSVGRLLNPSGIFWTILPFNTHIRFVQLANSVHLKPVKQIRVAQRPGEIPNRVVLGFQRAGSRLKMDTLTIRTKSSSAYTRQFDTLTAPFYLSHPSK